jgi:hypothetical protein
MMGVTSPRSDAADAQPTGDDGRSTRQWLMQALLGGARVCLVLERAGAKRTALLRGLAADLRESGIAVCLPGDEWQVPPQAPRNAGVLLLDQAELASPAALEAILRRAVASGIRVVVAAAPASELEILQALPRVVAPHSVPILRPRVTAPTPSDHTQPRQRQAAMPASSSIETAPPGTCSLPRHLREPVSDETGALSGRHARRQRRRIQLGAVMAGLTLVFLLTVMIGNDRREMWPEAPPSVASSITKASVSEPPTRPPLRHSGPPLTPAALDNLEMLKRQLDNGANPSALLPDGTTPLIQAVASRRDDIVRALLAAGAEPDGRDDLGRTPMIQAARLGNAAMVTALAAAGGHLNLPGDDGTTPLIAAARNNHGDLVDYLLRKGVYVDAQTNQGWTALMFAARDGHWEIVHLLVQAGADTGLINNDGQTAAKVIAPDDLKID